MSITKPDPPSAEMTKGRWELDLQRSRIGFRVRLVWGIGTVTGHFEDCSARLDLSATPAIELRIQAASVQTDNRRRDSHLRSGDFFDAENHPEVRFVSDSVVEEGKILKVSGRLLARGQSIPLNLNAQVNHLNGDLEINAATVVPHRELGMTWTLFGLIPGRSEVLINAHLVPARHTPQIPANGTAEEPN